MAGDHSDLKVPKQCSGHRAGRRGEAAAMCPRSCVEVLQEALEAAFDFASCASSSDSPYNSEKLGNTRVPCAYPEALLWKTGLEKNDAGKVFGILCR